ncbi:MAG: glycosyltransferase family 2 protein [Leptospirillia bacterium]
MKSPLISVVIPMTRYEKELPEALASVFSQTYQNFEIVLVDNNATEGSRIVANDWQVRNPDRIRIVREERKGASSARNRGIQESRGEFIAFLDSDDRMRPDRLTRQLDLIGSNKDIALIGSWFDEISSDGKNIVGKENKPSMPRWGKILFSGTPRWESEPFLEPQTSTYFFKRADALKIGMFDKNFDPFWLEDTDFSFRLYELGRVRIVPESLVEYRIHTQTDSIRRIFDLGAVVNHNTFFLKLRDKYFERKSKDSRLRFNRLASRWMRESGIKLLYYKGGDVLGKELIGRSFRLNPLDPKNLETIARINLPKPFYPKAFGVSPQVQLALPEYATLEWAQGLFSLD